MSWSDTARAASPPRRALLRQWAGWAAWATAGTVAGCGFQMRQPARVSFSSIALTGFAPRSPLAAELRRTLATQVRVLDDATKAEVVLQALEDKRERSVVASTAAAQVREMQLRLKFEFRVHTPAGRELVPKAALVLARDLSYSETAALAKEQEDGELFREMQADVVTQVMRRLASVTP